MEKVAITTLGCKTNQFESAAIVESLRKKGFQVVPFTDVADIYIINTCTVTAKTDAESRQLVRRANRKNPGAKIVVTGCYAQLAAEDVRKLPGVKLVLGNSEKKDLTEFLHGLGPEQTIMVSDISREEKTGGVQLESFAEHTRAFLQVQNGCDAFCSYCIVPYARGRSRSVTLDDALAGVATFSRQGYREVVLTGIHLGAYGLDLEPQCNLQQLLEVIEKKKSVPRLRLGSLEPGDMSDSLIALIISSKIICPHLHIPLQSGDDGVLRRMNRHYPTSYYREVVEKLRNGIPDACIGTDIIAGFPGESEEEFANTRAFLESLPLAYFHVFPFSPREKTPAALMDNQVDARIVKERAKILRDLSALKRKTYYGSLVGRELDVLVQSREPDGSLTGMARHYVPVCFPGEDSLVNTEVKVRILGVEKDRVRGEILG